MAQPLLPTSPAGEAMATLVSRSMRQFRRALRRSRRALHSPGAPDEHGASPPAPAATESAEVLTHRLRIACRRAQASLATVRLMTNKPVAKRARRLVRDVRRAAGPLRNCDVHEGLLRTLRTFVAGASGSQPTPAVDLAMARLRASRSQASRELADLLRSLRPRQVRRITQDAASRVHDALDHATFIEAAGESTRRLVAEILAHAPDLSKAEVAHEVRIRLKALRYALELFEDAGLEVSPPVAIELAREGQRRLGEANDIATLVETLDAWATQCEGTDRAGLMDLSARFRSVLIHRLDAARAWWHAENLASRLHELAITPLPVTHAPTDDQRAHAAPVATQRFPTPIPAPSDAAIIPARIVPPRLRMPQAPSQASHEPDQHDRADAPMPRDTGVGPHVLAELKPAGKPQDLLARSGSLQGELFLAGTRLGVIDIGSNSIRLLGVELIDDRNWNVLVEERSMTRLAHAMSETGELCPEAMARSVEAISRFKTLCDRLAIRVRAFATAAVRDASNRADFLSLVRDRTGLAIEIISGEREGKHTHRSVARAYDLSHGHCAVIDIGGGSMEVVTSHDGVITEGVTMPLGAVRLTEAFGGPEGAAGPRFDELRRHCERVIEKNVRTHDTPPHLLVGCGGTFTTLLTLSAHVRGVVIDRNSPALLELGPVTRDQLKAIIKHLRGMSLAERLRVPGLPSDRADIVIAGLTAVERLMRHLGCGRVHAHPGGVREGLLLKMIDDHRAAIEGLSGQASTSPDVLLRAARSLAMRCRYERAHSEHVARLATSLFDQLRSESALIQRLGEDPLERALLEAAAVLHDVGTLVEYRRHHKHSATIIRNAELPGVGEREQELIAQIARYHRRSEPRDRHPSFGVLAPKDQELVRRLAGLLRVADGLDRTHAQAVRGVHVRFARDGVRIEVLSAGDASEELRAAAEKGGLLESLLGVDLVFDPVPDAEAHAAANAHGPAKGHASQPAPGASAG